MNEKLNRTKELCTKTEQKMGYLKEDEIKQINESEKKVFEKKKEIELDMYRLSQIQKRISGNN